MFFGCEKVVVNIVIYMKNNKVLIILFLLLVYGVSFLYRINGLFSNPPFWVDEFSTASQARTFMQYGLSVFTNHSIFFEHNNITTHIIVALFFKLFGQHEWVARLPSVIIGSFVPIAVFYLTKFLFNRTAAICAAILTSFSFFEILWSRQARGYVLLQLIIILTLIGYFKLINLKVVRKTSYVLLVFLFFFGILTHAFFYILLITLGIHAVYVKKQDVFNSLKKPFIYVFLMLLLFITYSVGLLGRFLESIRISFIGIHNNLWYYHSFLWREYALITFLGLSGLVLGIIYKRKEFMLILSYIMLHLLFIGLIFGHYITKYLLPIFPFFLIGMAFTITKTTELVIDTTVKNASRSKILHFFIPIFIVFTLIANGDKFVNKPKIYYSLNRDFREIANINYNNVYDLIKEKGDLEKGQTAVIDTWIDRPNWYLGVNFQPHYIFRWINGGDITKMTYFKINEKGEKYIPRSEDIKLIGELSDLKKAMQKYPRGFIFIDDSTLPHDVIEYAEKNLKKELYLDHYPLDDNPYSIWPATLYSWGIN